MTSCPCPSSSSLLTTLASNKLANNFKVNLGSANSFICQQNNFFSGARIRRHKIACTRGDTKQNSELTNVEGGDIENDDMNCIGTGSNVECVVSDEESDFVFGGTAPTRAINNLKAEGLDDSKKQDLVWILESLLLISPFVFWGTAMVAMKGVLPKAGPFFVASTRLIPAGLLLIAYATLMGRKQPSGLNAWFSILLFGLVDALCFQGFLAEGLLKTSAGLGSVIIDSQPLTVAVLAAFFFDEKIGRVGVAGLALGVAGLLLLELPLDSLERIFSLDGFSVNFSSLWNNGEWLMLLAAQSMAIGTLMVRWVCKYSDPIMATGWHMVIGGIPLLALSALRNDPAMSGHLQDLQTTDWISLVYTSIFGSAISYGIYFYNATKGSLTKLSSLTFLTPTFAAFFGFLFLEETFKPLQIAGATVTLGSIYLINTRR